MALCAALVASVSWVAGGGGGRRRTTSLSLDVWPRFIAPDGVTRLAVLVNETFPGPVLRGRRGDLLRATVRNHLHTEVFSIHWHGLEMRHRPWDDGVASLTQCGIPPGGDLYMCIYVCVCRASERIKPCHHPLLISAHHPLRITLFSSPSANHITRRITS